MKFKKGMQFKSNRSHRIIELINRQGAVYWNTKRINGLGHNHRVAEGTLKWSYEVVER